MCGDGNPYIKLIWPDSMARTGQTLKNIFDNAKEILDKTVLAYKKNCVIPGYKIAYKVVFQDQQSLIYKLQVSNSSYKTFIKYKCIDVNLEWQIVKDLDQIFTYILHNDF